MEGFIIPNPEDTILWVGSMGNATFLASAPEGVSLGEKQGTASIRVAGLEIARLSFVVEVGSPGSTKTEEVLASSEKRHRKAFVCYASQDKKAVGARLQGMQKTSTELKVWVDSVELRSGQYWAKELVNVIPAQDIFYLFWSSHAKASKWVEMEWRCALSTRGLDFIDPVPLVSPNLVPPPPELASKHFDDWVLLFMRDGGQDTRE
ncbi:MAG: toll/interleukin-1 receptor domain-containing protein [Candidatus Eisenbacteria bacterium]|nr:toll/interleukin-1 receptor domain-containing protein [Candidatus Eisenbacteria bacterium]